MRTIWTEVHWTRRVMIVETVHCNHTPSRNLFSPISLSDSRSATKINIGINAISSKHPIQKSKSRTHRHTNSSSNCLRPKISQPIPFRRHTPQRLIDFPFEWFFRQWAVDIQKINVSSRWPFIASTSWSMALPSNTRMVIMTKWWNKLLHIAKVWNSRTKILQFYGTFLTFLFFSQGGKCKVGVDGCTLGYGPYNKRETRDYWIRIVVHVWFLFLTLFIYLTVIFFPLQKAKLLEKGLKEAGKKLGLEVEVHILLDGQTDLKSRAHEMRDA